MEIDRLPIIEVGRLKEIRLHIDAMMAQTGIGPLLKIDMEIRMEIDRLPIIEVGHLKEIRLQINDVTAQTGIGHLLKIDMENRMGIDRLLGTKMAIVK